MFNVSYDADAAGNGKITPLARNFITLWVFLIKTFNFEAEAERSCIFCDLRLKPFLNYMV